jgi:hypothetical protein
VCASIAVQMQSLAVGWQIYNLTDSPFEGLSATSPQPE